MNQWSGLRGRTKASTVSLAIAVLGLVLAPAPIFAQWIDTPTAGVPRTDGKRRAGPRSACAARGLRQAGSILGIWFSIGVCPGVQRRGVYSAGCGAARSTQTNIGRTLPDGLPYQPWAAALVATSEQPIERPGRSARTLPAAELPACVLVPAILQDPDDTAGDRRCTTSSTQPIGRSSPMAAQLPVDPNPLLAGLLARDAGRPTRWWFETIGFRDDLWLDLSGSPLTSAAHVTERFKRVDYGHLQIELTVERPESLHAAVDRDADQSPSSSTPISIEEICLENEQDTRLFDAQ